MAVYTVGLPRAMHDLEYADYLRPLLKAGLDITHAPRVIDPISGERWLYVWTDAAEVKAFVEALRVNSENDRWRVIPVPDAVPDVGPLGPVDVHLSPTDDRTYYQLSDASRRLIRRCFPQAILVSSVSIGRSSPPESDPTQSRLWDQVTGILTGLSEEQLAQLGGYRLIDWDAQRTLRKAPLHPPSGSRLRVGDGGRRPGQEGIPQPLEAERAFGLHVLGAEDKPQL